MCVARMTGGAAVAGGGGGLEGDFVAVVLGEGSFVDGGSGSRRGGARTDVAAPEFDGVCRVGVVECGEELADFCVVVAALEGECAWPAAGRS